MKYIKVVGTYHHNVEARVPNYLLKVWANPIPLEDLVPLMVHICDYSPCHGDYACQGEEAFDAWVQTNQRTLSNWLITTTQADAEDWEHTLAPPENGDWEDLNQMELFSIRDGDNRNIGCSLPGGDKYNTLWVRLEDVTIKVDVLADGYKRHHSHEALAQLYAEMQITT